MKIGAVVLAAGKAGRFGSPKQLLEIGGETLVDRACRIAGEAGFHPVLRVLGGHAEEIRRRPCPEGVETLVHPGWEDGMGSSLAAGVARLAELSPDLGAVVVMLADQPSVTPGLLAEMRSRLGHGKPVLCGYGGTTGPPAMFPARFFGELMALSGDRGAKSVAGPEPVLVPFPGGRWDLDTPDEWSRFMDSGDASRSR